MLDVAQFTKEPILVLDGQRYSLRDDGKEPDASSDGIFSVFVSRSLKKPASLLGDDQKVLCLATCLFPQRVSDVVADR